VRSLFLMLVGSCQEGQLVKTFCSGNQLSRFFYGDLWEFGLMCVVTGKLFE